MNEINITILDRVALAKAKPGGGAKTATAIVERGQTGISVFHINILSGKRLLVKTFSLDQEAAAEQFARLWIGVDKADAETMADIVDFKRKTRTPRGPYNKAK